jgi:hypothetical protein
MSKENKELRLKIKKLIRKHGNNTSEGGIYWNGNTIEHDNDYFPAEEKMLDDLINLINKQLCGKL